ncbi:hypothetical protein JCM17846_28780 [Iodidimonas nitroreducens]|uniref:Ribbon-helix-helix protein RHH domain-containing protein n=2 Tax=Iodidimonas nitroreducens TaxID=1236968 RepID=A0A5A7NE36_9PROT|nr:hypothetical protein JCM17846_28780 [Iodidimonas nitroreducens]
MGHLTQVGYAQAFRRWTTITKPTLDGLRVIAFSLAICVSLGYTQCMKDSGLRIRVERELREKFLEICRQQDRPAAQVLREFMRTYVEANESASRQKNHKKRQHDV